MKTSALLALSVIPAMAYVHAQRSGVNEYRADNANIQISLNSAAISGLNNSSGQPWIVAGSDIPGAASAALNAWNEIATANFHFAPLQTTSSLEGQDGENVIAFDDTPETRQMLGAALAVTVRYGSVDGGPVIEKSDILFNPVHVFSTNLAPGSYDFQSVLTHELGHALGSSHTGVLSATMFQASGMQNTDETVLSHDDMAFATETYPKQNGYGTLAGSVHDGAGNALRGALIAAQDPVTGIIVGSLSNFNDGTFSFILPAGNYQLWAEPLTGLVAAANLYIPATQVIDTAFQIGAPSSAVQVVAGSTTQAQIVPASGISPIQIKFAAAVPPNVSGGFDLYAGASSIPSGGQTDFIFEASGLGVDLTDSDFSFIGPVTLVPGSVVSLGRSQYQISLNVPATFTVTAASMFLNYKGSTAAYSGGLLIQPVTPQFTGPGVGNVFNYASGAVAPGEIVAIFGAHLGPVSPVGGFLDLGGNLASILAGVQVTFEGVVAPIFFASPGQINVEVPYEVAGKSAVTVAVSSGVSQSAPVVIPVQSATPGLFTSALNPDGTVNTQANPAPAGQYVVLYATGLGVLPGIATGQLAAAAAPASAVSVVVDGVTSQPNYAGAAPGFTGLDQVNLVGLTSGQHSIAVVASGQASQTIAVWVQ